MIYFTIFFWGLGRTHTEFSNAFLEQKAPWVIVPWDQIGAMRPLLDADSPEKKSLSIVIWSAVRKNEKKTLEAVGFSPEQKQEFAEWINQVKADFLVLEVTSNVENIDTDLNQLLPPAWDGRVLIQSEYEPVLVQMHVRRPLFAMGTSAPDRMRLLTFDSIGLVASVNFAREVFVTPLESGNRVMVRPSIVEEIRRRRRKVILGPLKTEADVVQASEFGPDGYFIVSEDAARALRQKH